MSIWADIHKRSSGVSERKEDIVVREEQEREKREEWEREIERYVKSRRFEVI